MKISAILLLVFVAILAFVLFAFPSESNRVCNPDATGYSSLSYSPDGNYLAAGMDGKVCIFKGNTLAVRLDGLKSFSWSSEPDIMFIEYGNSTYLNITRLDIKQNLSSIIYSANLLENHSSYPGVVLYGDNVLTYSSANGIAQNYNMLTGLKTDLPFVQNGSYVVINDGLVLVRSNDGSNGFYSMPDLDKVYTFDQGNPATDAFWSWKVYLSWSKKLFVDFYLPHHSYDSQYVFNLTIYNLTGVNVTAANFLIPTDPSILDQAYSSISYLSDDGRYLVIGSSYNIGATCEGLPSDYVCGGASVVILDIESKKIVYHEKFEKEKYNEVVVAWQPNSHNLSYLFGSKPLSNMKTLDLDQFN